jgi:uncharacterized protein
LFVTTADIGAEGLEVDRTLRLQPKQAKPQAGDLDLEPVVLQGRIDRVHNGFSFQGHLTTRVRLQCSRCLEPFGLPLDLSFDLGYRTGEASPSMKEAASGARYLDPEDPSVVDLDAGRIDLAQLIQEQVYLALPLKPLCEIGCRGLCPQCGARLDLGDCGCVTADVDPRWAALKALKDKL